MKTDARGYCIYTDSHVITHNAPLCLRNELEISCVEQVRFQWRHMTFKNRFKNKNKKQNTKEKEEEKKRRTNPVKLIKRTEGMVV